MLAALIFVLSSLLLAQFVFYAWRAAMVSAASAPLSEQMQQVTGLPPTGVRPEDFPVLASLHAACPPLGDRSHNLTPVRIYYRCLRFLDHFAPNGLSPWTQREMAVCARFAAVCLDRRLRHNQEWLMGLSGL
jgi:hypothetical protein